MKNIWIIALIFLLLFNCNSNNHDGTTYLINGTAKDCYNGIRVYLKNIDESGREIISDTAIVINETFKMTGAVPEPSLYFLDIDGVQEDIIFMLENNEIDIDVNKMDPMLSKVSGSKSHEGFVAFQDGLNTIRKESKDVMVAYRQEVLDGDKVKLDSLSKRFEDIGARMVEHPLNFVKNHRDSYFSLNLIGLEANKSTLDVEGFMSAFNNLDSTLKTSLKGIRIAEKLSWKLEEHKKIAHLEIGKIAPNFEAPDPNGKMITLNDIRGKVTVIDFWAAWCGPCRRENPNMVKLYERFNKDGLEILGVSLDGARSQKDSKNEWLTAIKNDKLSWKQVSFLNYFNGPVAQLYNIKAIPATYILDEEGKIVAKDLRGRALELKIESLLSIK